MNSRSLWAFASISRDLRGPPEVAEYEYTIRSRMWAIVSAISRKRITEPVTPKGVIPLGCNRKKFPEPSSLLSLRWMRLGSAARLMYSMWPWRCCSIHSIFIVWLNMTRIGALTCTTVPSWNVNCMLDRLQSTKYPLVIVGYSRGFSRWYWMCLTPDWKNV